MNIVDLFFVGGYVLLPLLGCSVMLLAIILHKWKSLKYYGQKLEFLSQSSIDIEKVDSLEKLNSFLAHQPSEISKAFLEINKNKVQDVNKNEHILSRRVWEFEQKLKRFLWLVGSMASLAPFIGLFGTVVGIIKSFSAISEAGKGGFAVVSAGLSEALIATAAGILLAIFASFFYNYFNHKIALLKREFIYSLEEFINAIEGRR